MTSTMCACCADIPVFLCRRNTGNRRGASVCDRVPSGLPEIHITAGYPEISNFGKVIVLGLV